MTRLIRLHLPQLDPAGGEHEVDGPKAHHLRKVLRLAAGHQLLAHDGRGMIARGVVVEVGRRCLLRFDAAQEASPRRLELELWLPLIRPARFETVVEKSVELGIARIRPFTSEHCGNQERLPEQGRLERVMSAALEQSGNPWLPVIEPLCDLGTLLNRPEPALLSALPQGAAEDWIGLRDRPFERLALLAGPEGGFSETECERVRKRSTAIAGLGAHVLRAETALISLAGLARALAHEPHENL